MHPTGEKTLAALQQMYPGYTIKAQEYDYGCVLAIGVERADGKRLGVHTPFTLDYRLWDYKELLHRVNTVLEPKLS